MAVSIEAVMLLKPKPGEVLFVELAADAEPGDLDGMIGALRAATCAAGWPLTPIAVVAANVDLLTLDRVIADLQRMRAELADG